MDYQASMHAKNSTAANYIGLVFGYHNNREFYVAIWRHNHLNRDSGPPTGLKGIQIKVMVQL